MSEKTLYEMIGGEVPLRNLVNSFYRHMDTLSDAQELRAIHSADLSTANQKLFEFLSGWMGGPSLFIEKYGHPRLRARHLPFAIGTKERDQWVLCMVNALEECQTSREFNDQFLPAIAHLADFMRNKQDEK